MKKGCDEVPASRVRSLFPYHRAPVRSRQAGLARAESSVRLRDRFRGSGREIWSRPTVVHVAVTAARPCLGASSHVPKEIAESVAHRLARRPVAGGGFVRERLRRTPIHNSDDPAGRALVVSNGEEIGISPASRSFVYYGERDITLYKDGYKTRRIIEKMDAPWWDNRITEFFTETLVPFTIRDDREYVYKLEPEVPTDEPKLLQDAEACRYHASTPAEAAVNRHSRLAGSVRPHRIERNAFAGTIGCKMKTRTYAVGHRKHNNPLWPATTQCQPEAQARDDKIPANREIVKPRPALSSALACASG